MEIIVAFNGVKEDFYCKENLISIYMYSICKVKTIKLSKMYTYIQSLGTYFINKHFKECPESRKTSEFVIEINIHKDMWHVINILGHLFKSPPGNHKRKECV